MSATRPCIWSALSASRVTTSLPAGELPCTRAPGMRAIACATLCMRRGGDCTTRLLMWTSAGMPASATRRAGEHLVDPDQEAVAADDHDREHGSHHDGQEQEASQLLCLGERLARFDRT